METPKSKSADQIALEMETEGKRLLEIARVLKGKKKISYLPKPQKSVKYGR